MKIAFNFAHNTFIEAQKLNTKTAYENGCVDKVFEYNMSDIEKLDSDFYEANKKILLQNRGAGYWLFKFFFMNYLLNDNKIEENSYIIYSDSGSYFIDSVDKIIEVLERDKTPIFLSRQNHLSYVFTKRDMFILTNSDEHKYTHTCQRAGGWHIVKKCDISREFYKECLYFGTDIRILTDLPNQCGIDNYNGFLTHRHDESLVSILAKKYDLYPYRNPSQHGFCDDIDWTHKKYGEKGLIEMIDKYGTISTWLSKYGLYFHGESLNQYPLIFIDEKSTYPQIFHLHRNSNLTEVNTEHKK